MCANSVESVVDLQPAQDYDGPFIGAATFVKIVQLSLVTARHHVVVVCKNANRGTELCHLITDTFESQVHAVTANRVVWRDGGSITMYSRHHKHVYREGTEWRVIRQRGPTFVVWG